LTDALSRSGEGGQAVRDAMIQGGLLPPGHEDEDEPDDYPQIVDPSASFKSDLDQRKKKAFTDLYYRHQAENTPNAKAIQDEKNLHAQFDEEINDYNQRTKENREYKNQSLRPVITSLIKKHLPQDQDNTDNTEGKDQEILDTIAGRGDSLDRLWQRDAGSALLSAMRAGGMTFDAKWPSNVDRYEDREKDAGRMRPVSTERR